MLTRNKAKKKVFYFHCPTTLIFNLKVMTRSGMDAVISGTVLLKMPAIRSFWPISNVYKASVKYSSLGISDANVPPYKKIKTRRHQL